MRMCRIRRREYNVQYGVPKVCAWVFGLGDLADHGMLIRVCGFISCGLGYLDVRFLFYFGQVFCIYCNIA